jgi:hypothetical protein
MSLFTSPLSPVLKTMRKEKAKETRKTSPQAALIHTPHPLDTGNTLDVATLLSREAKWMLVAAAVDR